MNDTISRQEAIDALWKALYEYEEKTEKQFLESDELDVYDWVQHRVFVQNMSDIDRQTILNLPSAQPTADVVERKMGKWTLNKEGNWACPFCEFDPYHDNMKGMNYCPNCGARLEGYDAEVH